MVSGGATFVEDYGFLVYHSFLPEDKSRKPLQNVRKYCKLILCYVWEAFNLQINDLLFLKVFLVRTVHT